MGFANWADQQLQDIGAADRRRRLRTFDAIGPTGKLNDSEVVSFASNDYLGLSAHPAVLKAAHEALDRWGTGATASRLVVGSRPVHDLLEAELATWKGTERSLVFPSGYAANLGVLSTLGGPDCVVISDELNHASIIDGCRLSRSKVVVTRHNDTDHVRSILAESAGNKVIVVTEAVFSMDGDEAPVAALGRLCAHHGALLVIDEAHAVLGPELDEVAALEGLELLRVVTMSKAIGALGGAVCGPDSLIDLLVNRARSFIFTTALSPADAAAGAAAIQIINGPEGVRLTTRLRAVVERVAPGHASPIVPIIVGSEADAVAAAEQLLSRGLLVPAIRPPTVAPGTSRLRVALSAAHTDEMIDRLLDGLADLGFGR